MPPSECLLQGGRLRATGPSILNALSTSPRSIQKPAFRIRNRESNYHQVNYFRLS
jgi:hypothetical protein